MQLINRTVFTINHSFFFFCQRHSPPSYDSVCHPLLRELIWPRWQGEERTSIRAFGSHTTEAGRGWRSNSGSDGDGKRNGAPVVRSGSQSSGKRRTVSTARGHSHADRRRSWPGRHFRIFDVSLAFLETVVPPSTHEPNTHG